MRARNVAFLVLVVVAIVSLIVLLTVFSSEMMSGYD